jgi:hypothetical protein
MLTHKDKEAPLSPQKEADQQAQTAQQAQAAQQQLAILQAQINTIAPETDHVHIVVTRHNNVVEVGLFDTQPGGPPAWAVRRHPNDKIAWTVPQDVTINAIKAKPGTDPLPIDVDPIEHGGSPGVSFKAMVRSDAGNPGGPGNPSTKTYDYLIDVTYKPAHGSAIGLMIDPEFIVNRP